MTVKNGALGVAVLGPGQESARSVVHLAELFGLADRARLLQDAELAVARMKLVLALAGV